MKISPKFKLRSIVGQNVIIMQGKYGGDMTKIISLNDSSVFLWNKFHETEFTIDDVAAALVEEYDIDENLAHKDAQAWCDKIAECGLLVKVEDEPLFSNGKNE